MQKPSGFCQQHKLKFWLLLVLRVQSSVYNRKWNKCQIYSLHQKGDVVVSTLNQRHKPRTSHPATLSHSINSLEIDNVLNIKTLLMLTSLLAIMFCLPDYFLVSSQKDYSSTYITWSLFSSKISQHQWMYERQRCA